MLLRAAGRPPELEAHLDRDLDGDRAGVAQENVLKAVGGDLREPRAEADRWLVGEPAEHDMAHASQLCADRLIQGRVAVSVDGGPPRRHPIDQFVHAIDGFGKLQPNGFRGLHHQWTVHSRHRSVRMPGVHAVELDQLVIG